MPPPTTPQAGLLLTNSLLILNRKRFLSKYSLAGDLSSSSSSDAIGGNQQQHFTRDRVGSESIRGQVVGLLAFVDYLKMPVIALNVFTIIFEMLLGGT